MSELKAINAYQLTTNTEDSDVYIHNDEFGCGGDLVECYLKSEADKVITEKNAEIASLNREIAKIQDKMCEDVFEGIMPSEHIVCRPLQQAAEYIAELKAQKAQAEDDCAFWKTKAQRERHHKFKRCLLYAKNHKNLGDLATDTARLIGLNAYAFTKETETACVAYWNRIRDCHYRRHDEWLELAEKFNPNSTATKENSNG